MPKGEVTRNEQFTFGVTVGKADCVDTDVGTCVDAMAESPKALFSG